MSQLRPAATDEVQMNSTDPERFHPQMPPSTAWALKSLILEGRDVAIGRWSYGAPLIAWAKGDTKRRLRIGNFCSIAAGVSIYVGLQGRHTMDFLSTYPMGMIFNGFGGPVPSAEHTGNLDVIIGNDVWIGRDSMIMAGVTIGDGAVVAARSVVAKDVPPYAIVGGVAAKVLRYRFEPKIIETLLKIKWWDWPDEEIQENLNLFSTNDIQSVLTRIGEKVLNR
jgi:chloramphenicol O-acetyltransferase type B